MTWHKQHTDMAPLSMLCVVVALADAAPLSPRAHAAPLLRLRGGDTSSILTTAAAPALAAALSNAMLWSRHLELSSERKEEEGTLTLSPLGSAARWSHRLAWTVYALLTRDPYILAANLPALLLATWESTTCLLLAEPAASKQVESALLVAIAGHAAVGTACSFISPSRPSMAALYGVACNALALHWICIYSAPATAIVEAVSRGSSAPIDLQKVGARAADAALWLTYALAIGDVFVAIPHAVRLVLAVVHALVHTPWGAQIIRWCSTVYASAQRSVGAAQRTKKAQQPDGEKSEGLAEVLALGALSKRLDTLGESVAARVRVLVPPD